MASLLRPARELLARYAAYHRDRRNILTHFVGVPLVVFALGVLLGRAGITLAGMRLSGAWLAVALVAPWYLTRGVFTLGLATTLGIAALVFVAHGLSDGSMARWLTLGAGGLVIGWVVQFVGHYYEGRKPAFADDLTNLLVGPMFVAMEGLVALGLLRDLASDVERRAGPTMLRDLACPAPR